MDIAIHKGKKSTPISFPESLLGLSSIQLRVLGERCSEGPGVRAERSVAIKPTAVGWESVSAVQRGYKRRVMAYGGRKEHYGGWEMGGLVTDDGMAMKLRLGGGDI